MPLVKIEIIKGHGEEYKKVFLQTVHDALVNVLSIPDNDRFQRIYELEACDFERNPEKMINSVLLKYSISGKK